jgi:hypothetical protein
VHGLGSKSARPRAESIHCRVNCSFDCGGEVTRVAEQSRALPCFR